MPLLRSYGTRLCGSLAAFGVALITSNVVSAATSSGTLDGTIAGNTLALTGTCSKIEGAFEFWSDSTEFAVNKDMNGDGRYINIMVRAMGSQTIAMMRYSESGDTLYNGTFKTTSFDGQSVSADTPLGREQNIHATFQVTCD